MIIRRATLDDIPYMVTVQDRSRRLAPDQAAKYGSCTQAEYCRFKGEQFVHRISDPSFEAWIAINPYSRSKENHRPEGEVCGILIFAKRGMGVKEGMEGMGLPPARLPEGSNLDCLKNWRALLKQMKDEQLTDIGPHYRGELLAVLPEYQYKGVGSKLCEFLGQRAIVDGVPVYFETSYYALPFYDRFATQHGYKLTHHGNPIKMPNTRLPVYEILLRFEKRPEGEKSPEFKRISMVGRRFGWE